MSGELILILIIGIPILLIFIYCKIKEDIVDQKKKIAKAADELRNWGEKVHQKEIFLQSKEELLKKREMEFSNILKEKEQKFPYLATILADWKHKNDIETAEHLEHKERPALRAAEEIRNISKEKRKIEKERNAYKNQLELYEYLFPWLEEFKELPPEEAFYYAVQPETDDEYSLVKDWLSPEEYAKLSSVEKWQRALDRYLNRKNKTNWHIGIEYERYIGYVYESKGFKVRYEGALMGLEDKGRDIIVEKDSEILVIQCKRWAQEKEIHEKHIMQLFGSVAALSMESDKKYRGIFITTTKLSKTAKHFAKLLDIEVVENYQYRQYPLVKCNVSYNGEKIYHLPFDQQYDRISIELKKGNYYVSTVKEAEEKGFRHAYRWMGSGDSQ